ncbi:alpha-L-fucosidase [Candidatus Epulonipiscium viviparus]|uniref:alpha-L-fucosidase n=1 Tax=Candidatus Epulonipiscium viviparus TaxID=420336 RepID=UPI000494FE7E|nr:alpha-L-fucosidase [Candidatus Epulopiscium viviparus]
MIIEAAEYSKEHLNNYLKTIDEVISKGPYKDDWENLVNYPVPKWYRDAKFGIFMHWGVYTVPAFGSEWYPNFMYRKGAIQRGKDIYSFHQENFGAGIDYRDFVPMFKAEKFDADEWAEFFRESGAKFVMPVAEHCDGFQMYDSVLSDWCASKMGPQKDVMGLLKTAIEAKGMTFCASSHRMEHYWFMGGMREREDDPVTYIPYGDMYWPSYERKFDTESGEKTPSFGAIDLVNIDELFMQDWLARTCEIVDKYRPKIMYFDWWIQIKPMKPYLKKFAAYYYNRGKEWGEEVTINYKNDAFAHTSAVKDIERGQLSGISPYFWQNDTSVAKNSWSYTPGNIYKDASEVVATLVDVVSKNGSLLLNVGPKSDGTLPEGDVKVLRDVGKWLRVNGDAIYGSYPYRKYGEGPTVTEEGHFSDMNFKGYATDDFRFTCNKAKIYIFAMNWPADGVIHVKTFGNVQHNNRFNAVIKKVSILGHGECEFRSCDAHLTIIGPKIKTKYPVVIQLDVD